MAVDRVARCMAMDAGGGTAPVDSYTKSETDALLEQKADKSEVTESVTAAVAQIVANAPEDFDTLQEMSDWITSHEDSAAAMNSAILQNAADIEAVEIQQTEQAAAISAVTEEAALNRSTLGYQRKNLLNNKKTTKTISGVTFTVNEDKTVTVNGTSTAIITGFAINSEFQVGDKPMILSGCPSGGSQNTYQLDIVNGVANGGIVVVDTGNGARFSKSEVTTSIGIIRIRIAKGTTLNNVVFKPMIRDAEITDDTYEPYKPSVQEQIDALIDRISALESSQTDIITSQNISDKIITMNVEDEKHERAENLEQTD